MNRPRDTSFDFLRSAAILNAFLLHLNTKGSIGIFAKPSVIADSYLFTTGAVFFFAAGYMARRVYLPAFVVNPVRTTFHIMRKGMLILFLYVVYVVSVHLGTNTSFPADLWSLMLGHEFFCRVLLTFAVLYLLLPWILLLVMKGWKWVVAGLILLLSVFLFKDYIPGRSAGLHAFVFDRSRVFYAVVPSLVTLCIGFAVASWEDIRVRFAGSKHALIGALILVVHFVLLAAPQYRNVFRNRSVFTIFESLVVFIALILIRWILSKDRVRKKLEKDRLLCIGRKSLTFYVGSNALLSLSRVTPAWSPAYKMGVSAVIVATAYLAALWHYRSSISRSRSWNAGAGPGHQENTAGD